MVHTVFRSKEGNIYHEELKGNKGFDGPSALLYHIYPPTEVVSTKVVDTFVLEEDPNSALRMRHFYTDRLSKGGSPVTNRTPLLFNNDVIISASHPDQNDDFYCHYIWIHLIEITRFSKSSTVLPLMSAPLE